MEHRFSFKDFVICALLVAVIVVVLLAMKQYDREWSQLQNISGQMDQQTRSQQQLYQSQQQVIGRLDDQTARLDRLEQALARGVPAHINLPPTTQAGPAATEAAADLLPPVGANEDPFKYIHEAEKMPGYKRGDSYVRAFGVLPPILTPLRSTDVYGSIIQGYVLDSLATRDDRTLAWRPLLAQSWQVSRDGLRIEFQIRRGVTFSDGVPLTADDVVFTYHWIMNPQVECPQIKIYYDRIKDVVKLNDYRVAFIFKKPYFKGFEIAATMQVMPKHFYSKYTPTEFNRNPGLLMGSGPYRLATSDGWRPDPGKPIELVRNERYWGPLGVFDKIVFQVIQNEAARLTTFRNGQLDTFGSTPEQYRQMLKDPGLLARTRHFEYTSPGDGYQYIGWNEKRDGKPTPFTDPRVRLAMTLLTDRQAILKDIFYGYGIIPDGPFAANSPQVDPNIKHWPYDPARALKLLQEAGYHLQNGVLLAPDGQPFSFKLSYPSSGELGKRIVLFIKDMYAKAGIQVIPDPVLWALLLQRLDQRNFEAVTLGWSGEIETDPYQIFDSASIPAPGSNFISYSNPQLDRLIEAGRSTINVPERMAIWHQVAQVLHQDQPYTFLLTRKDLTWVDKRFQNVKLTKLGLNSELEWWVPAGERRWTQ